jgi:hypothetical protein
MPLISEVADMLHMSTYCDANFDETTFEVQLTVNRSAAVICYYWILKLIARFLSGDYVEALAIG